MPVRHGFNPLIVYPVFLIDHLMRTSRTAFYLTEVGFITRIGTIYAISLGEWLRLASLASGTPDRQFRKCVLKCLDGEARL